MRKLPVLRASSTERWLNCTWFSSHEWPEGESSEAAARGSRVHAGIAQHFGAAKDEPGPRNDEEHALVSVGIGYAEELIRSAGAGWQAHVEQTIEYADGGDEFRGTADLVLVNGDHAVLVDWKTGQRHSGYEPQMLTYAWLIARTYGVKRVDVRIVYLSSGEEDQMSIGEEAIVKHSETIMVASSRRSEERPAVTPGHWCTWCPGSLYCPKNVAIVSEVEKALALKFDLMKLAISVDTELEAQAAHAIVEHATELIAKIESNLKQFVRESGPLKTREGQSYSVMNIERTTLSITPPLALLLERSGVGDCIKMSASWSDVKKKLAKNAVALETLEASLRESNALTTSRYEKWTTK